MNYLMQTIAELAMEIHPDTMKRVAAEVSRQSCPKAGDTIGTLCLHGKAAILLKKVLEEWHQEASLSPGELAAALLAASRTASFSASGQTLELVWSGPDTHLVPIRRTEQVLIDIIEGTRTKLFLVSFVAYAVPSVTKALRSAAERGVQIEILLELAEEHGGKISVDSVALIKKAIPEATVYIWHPEGQGKIGIGQCGSVHAKCAVADSQVAFVTSANLTGAAMEKNMEIGVLVRGGTLPEQLDRHLRTLVTTREISKV